MKTLLTRIGENTKYIISGDLDQSDKYDNVTQSGLYDAIQRLKGVEEIGFYEFSEDDIVRNPLISKILKNYKKTDIKTLPNPPRQEPRLIVEGKRPIKPTLKDKESVIPVKKNWFQRNFKL